MKLFPFLLTTAAAGALLTACDRQQGAAQREADERRIAELRDLEAKAAAREAVDAAAQNEADRQKIDEERAALERDRANLTAAQRETAEKRIAALEKKQARDEAAARAAREQRATQAQAAEPMDYFYRALEGEGDWMEVGGQGYVWQPRAARDPSWRPYTDGHWVWTEYGWTWSSNEPYGWAVYHYGRWTRLHGRGWVWTPGSEWAPAWVSWRRSPEYVGWAPLPPEAHSHGGFTGAVDSYYDIGPTSYAFVPVANLAEPTYVGRVVEPERSVRIVNETTNITNLNYRSVQNTTVLYNAGPNLAQVEAETHATIPRVTVERVSDPAAAKAPSAGGKVLRMLAPVIAAAPHPASAPPNVKTRVAATEVDRGWKGADSATAEATRAKIAQEAQAAEQHQRAPGAAASAGVHPHPSTELPPVAEPAAPAAPHHPTAAPLPAARQELRTAPASTLAPRPQIPTPPEPVMHRLPAALPAAPALAHTPGPVQHTAPVDTAEPREKRPPSERSMAQPHLATPPPTKAHDAATEAPAVPPAPAKLHPATAPTTTAHPATTAPEKVHQGKPGPTPIPADAAR